MADANNDDTEMDGLRVANFDELRAAHPPHTGKAIPYFKDRKKADIEIEKLYHGLSTHSDGGCGE